MNKQIMVAQIDHFLTNIRSETKVTLVQFKESGLTIDDDLIKCFLEVSIESLTQTCEAFKKECDVKNEIVQSPSDVDTCDGDTNSSKDNKRKLETANDEVVPLKKQKMMPLNSDAIEKTSQQKKKGDGCTDSKDSSRESSGTFNEINEHLLSSHQNANECSSKSLQHRATVAQQKNTLFFCDYCIDPTDSNKLFSGTLNEVYEHWLSTHLTAPISQLFQFHAVDMNRCIHCEAIGTYHDLVEHHRAFHLNEFFAVSDQINRNKCGICHFIGGNLVEHFYNCHESVLPQKMFNPVFYTEDRIMELLKMNAEKNVFVDDQSSAAYLVCGFCAKIVDVHQYLNHFKKHSYNFTCSMCPYLSLDLAELIYHERIMHGIDTLNYHCTVFPDWLRNTNFNTKMVFANGLVMKKYNVLGTKFDDSNLFNVFIEALLAAKRVCLEQMMRMNFNPYFNDVQQMQLPQYMTTPVDESTIIAELNKQRCLKNTLYIHGTKSLMGDGLENFFLKLCQKLEVNVLSSDIKHIREKYSNGISVELHRLGLKETILKRAKERTILSNELVPLAKGEIPWKVSIYHDLTPFYFDISQAALAFIKSKQIVSFNIGKDGFVVKRSSFDAGHIVRSKQELINYINRK